jgi:hypothetical protein
MLEKLISGTLTAAILAASTPVYARIPDEYRLSTMGESEVPVQKYSLTQMGISAPEQNKCPPYLMHLPECQQPAPAYVPAPTPAPNPSPNPSPSPQPAPAPIYYYQPQPYQAPPEKSSSHGGCGTTCAVIGGIITAASLGLLIVTLNKQEEERKYFEDTGHKDPTSSTAPILFGIGALGGAGLMIYGLSTMD